MFISFLPLSVSIQASVAYVEVLSIIVFSSLNFSSFRYIWSRSLEKIRQARPRPKRKSLKEYQFEGSSPQMSRASPKSAHLTDKILSVG